MSDVSLLKRIRSLVRADGWENVITGLGTTRDKRTGGRVTASSSTRTHTEVEEIYHGDDLAAVMAERPAEDMIREWIAISVDQTPTDGPDDDAAKSMQRFLRSKMIPQKMGEGILWGKVFGGSIMFMGFDDGAMSLSDPLDENRLRSFSHAEVFDRFDVRIAEHDMNPMSPTFGQPSMYELLEHVLPGGVVVPNEARFIHASRTIRFPGAKTTRRRRRENMGWDDSIYEKKKGVLRDFNLAWGGIAHLLQDFAQMVIKIQGLADALAEDSEKLIIDRLLNMDLCRSIVRAIPLDAEMEEAERKPTPVQGLADLMDRFALRFSASAEMPATLLFGQSPAGMNATGESDIQLYYDRIAAEQEETLRAPLNRLIDLLWRTAEGPTRGSVPAQWSFDFVPLWQMDDKEKTAMRKTQAETDVAYIEQGVLDPDEVRQSRFGGDAYSIETVLQEREPMAPMPGGDDE